MLFNTTPAILIARLIVLLVAFSVHEFAHAWAADRFGDSTPRAQGRLTLNPLAHLDLLGSLMLLFAGFGWAKPVEVNPYFLRRRSPMAMMWVALAGPASNLMLAVIGAIPFMIGILSYFSPDGQIFPTPTQLMVEFVWINLVLMLFNLIPLYPLDGEKIAMDIFPPSWRNVLERIRPYSSLILIAVVFFLPRFGIDILGVILGPPLNFLFSLLMG